MRPMIIDVQYSTGVICSGLALNRLDANASVVSTAPAPPPVTTLSICRTLADEDAKERPRGSCRPEPVVRISHDECLLLTETADGTFRSGPSETDQGYKRLHKTTAARIFAPNRRHLHLRRLAGISP